MGGVLGSLSLSITKFLETDFLDYHFSFQYGTIVN